jgi:anti-sigma-K factor RskA
MTMQDSRIHIDQDTLAAYALDALTSDELVAIGEHLRACEQCSREAATLRATAGLLPYGLVEAEPPADLRARVINAATSGQATPARAPSRPARRAWLRRLAPGLAALTFAAGLLLGRAWPVADPNFQAQSDGQVVTLTGHGSGTVLVANDHTYVRLTVTGLPALETGKVYQLWFLGRSVPISAGTFAAKPDGSSEFELSGLAWSPEYTGIAITIEPRGGNAAPTSDIVAKADI